VGRFRISEKVRQSLPFLFILFLFLIIYMHNNNAYREKIGKIRFYKEIISICPEETEFRVIAVYFYRNLSQEEVILKALAPFPIDKNHSYPHDISLRENDGLPVVYDKKRKSIDFYLVFKPGEEKTLTLDYRQRVKTREGRYILTTTSSWFKPMDEGYYFLYPPEGSKLISSTYPVDLITKDDTGYYYFEKKNFMPPVEWDFAWTKSIDKNSASDVLFLKPAEKISNPRPSVFICGRYSSVPAIKPVEEPLKGGDSK